MKAAAESSRTTRSAASTPRNACMDCQPFSTRRRNRGSIRTAPTPLPWPRSSTAAKRGAARRASGWSCRTGPAQNTATLTADGRRICAASSRSWRGRQRHAPRHTNGAVPVRGIAKQAPVRRQPPQERLPARRRAAGRRSAGRAGRRRPAGDPGERQRPADPDRRVDAHGDERARLARGNDVPLPLRRSGNKPYCDGTHKKIGFTA